MKLKSILGILTILSVIILMTILGMQYLWINYVLVLWASVDIGISLANHFGLITKNETNKKTNK